MVLFEELSRSCDIDRDKLGHRGFTFAVREWAALKSERFSTN
jgi:hypothetical protein